LAVVIEEADEALYWLEHLSESKMVAAEDAELLRCEATELVAIFTTAHKTARANLSRRKTLRRASTKRGA
jgi:hypothetical protein